MCCCDPVPKQGTATHPSQVPMSAGQDPAKILAWLLLSHGQFADTSPGCAASGGFSPKASFWEDLQHVARGRWPHS